MLSEWLDKKSISLNVEEILLIDWTICGASRIIPNMEVVPLVVDWHPLRMTLWDAVSLLGNDSKKEIKLPVEESEARTLLALAPTTFRWGTGPDCGFSLKQKLSRFLQGETNDEESKGATGDQPAG